MIISVITWNLNFASIDVNLHQSDAIGKRIGIGGLFSQPNIANALHRNVFVPFHFIFLNWYAVIFARIRVSAS